MQFLFSQKTWLEWLALNLNAANRRLVSLAGASGILASTLPLIMIFASTELEESFSWSRNALSDVGVADQAWLFNSALIIGGLLSLLFAFGLRSFLDKARKLKIGISLFIVSSISLTLVGVFTEDYLIIHGLVALGYLLLAPSGLLFIGLGEKVHGLGKISLLLGVLASFSITLFPVIVVALSLQIGFAVPEFLEALLLSIWIFFVSMKLLRC